VRLPPALTISAQVVLGLANGVLGVMMAAPFVAVTNVLVRRLVVEDVVEQKASGMGPEVVLVPNDSRSTSEDPAYAER
jgi:predicted PurR-regulated permease PerM